MTVLPQPSDRLIAYLDILGWSEIVRDEKRAADVAGAMLEVQAEKDTFEFGRRLARADYSVQMSEFSDCVAFSCDLNSKTAPEQLLHQVCRLYLLWLRRGFLCRGAVVVGRAVHVDNVIYGAGLVDAYHLEREVAIYPRIVVREADIDRVNLRGRILRMDDGVPFLNPMLHLLLPPSPPVTHEQIVSTLTANYGRWKERRDDLKQASAPAKVIAKHDWLLRYLEKSAEAVDLKPTE